MTGTPMPGTLDGTLRSPLNDESQLEQLFRSRFQALCEEARTHLGPDAAATAPRVVEAALKQTWEDRAQLASAEQLEAHLHEAVKHAAARQLSRRASAHLYGSSLGTASKPKQAGDAAPDVDAAWSRLHLQLHPEERADSAKEYAEHLRHDAAHHMKDMAKPRQWKGPVAVGVVGLAVVLAGMWYVQRLGEAGAINNALNAPDGHAHAAVAGQMAIVTLDDGTRVTMAPESKLTVPKSFGEKIHAVKLEGAATFEVVPGQKTPLHIRAGNAAVLVTGTKLTVRAYPTDSSTVVQVTDGAVTVRVGEAERPVAKGQALLIDHAGAMRAPSATELAEGTSWTQQRVTIVDRQLRDAVPQLHRWYGTQIKVPDLSLLDRRASVDASLDSLRVAISQVERSAGVEFGYEGTTMVFRAPKGKTAGARKR